jgi:hypothetical protein
VSVVMKSSELFGGWNVVAEPFDLRIERARE